MAQLSLSLFFFGFFLNFGNFWIFLDFWYFLDFFGFFGFFWIFGNFDIFGSKSLKFKFLVVQGVSKKTHHKVLCSIWFTTEAMSVLEN